MNWTTLSETELPEWMDLANTLLASDGPLVQSCPSCGSRLRDFMHRRPQSGRGGLWVWCSNCGRHYHASCIVPAWWVNVPEIGAEQLADPPEYLNSIWEHIAPTPDSPPSTPRGRACH
jgi:hypothetical protein